jgi:hypothetical protein
MVLGEPVQTVSPKPLLGLLAFGFEIPKPTVNGFQLLL